MKQENMTKAILLLSFIIVAVFGFDYIITSISSTTGKATGSSGEVNIFIIAANASNVTSNATTDPVSNISVTGGSGIGRPTNIGLQISTPVKQNIQFLQIVAIANEKKVVQLLLKNLGHITLNLKIDHELPYVVVDTPLISIPPGGRGTVIISVFGPGVGSYTGLINFRHKLGVVQLPTLLTILPQDLPYTLDVTIPEAFKTVQVGKELLAEISLNRLTEDSVLLQYFIKDMQDTVVYTGEEITLLEKIVGGKVKLDKTIKLPPSLSVGDYALVVESDHAGDVLTAADSFTVVEGLVPREEVPQKDRPWWIILLLLLFLYIVTRLLLRKKKKKKR
jgi:hypothetical protein